jgi:hypothetical protein
LCALWRTFRRPEAAGQASAARGLDWATLAVVALGGTVLIVHESFGFKIVMDEVMLAGTSMSMHFEQDGPDPFAGATSRAPS